MKVTEAFSYIAYNFLFIFHAFKMSVVESSLLFLELIFLLPPFPQQPQKSIRKCPQKSRCTVHDLHMFFLPRLRAQIIPKCDGSFYIIIRALEFWQSGTLSLSRVYRTHCWLGSIDFFGFSPARRPFSLYTTPLVRRRRGRRRCCCQGVHKRAEGEHDAASKFRNRCCWKWACWALLWSVLRVYRYTHVWERWGYVEEV